MKSTIIENISALIYIILESLCDFILWCDFRYKGQAPDLLGKQDSVYEGNGDCGRDALN